MLPQVANEAPLPGTINYLSLSPASREVIGQIALRVMAGWSTEEISSEFNRTRPTFRHLNQPKAYTMGWVNCRLRELREDIRATAELVLTVALRPAELPLGVLRAEDHRLGLILRLFAPEKRTPAACRRSGEAPGAWSGVLPRVPRPY